MQSGDGDAAGALESLRKARTIAPNSEEVLSAFAQMSIAAGAPVPAIGLLELGVEWRAYARALLDLYRDECADVESAAKKVRWVP